MPPRWRDGGCDAGDSREEQHDREKRIRDREDETLVRDESGLKRAASKTLTL